MDGDLGSDVVDSVVDKNVIKQVPCWTEQEEVSEFGVTGYHSIVPVRRQTVWGLSFSVSPLENGFI